MSEFRKIIGILLSLLIVAGVFAPAVSYAESYDSGTVTGDNVAFRDGAGKDSGIIARLKLGTVLDVLDTNVNAEWHKVRYNGRTGYVNRMYVRLEKAGGNAQKGYNGTVVNCSDCVNVRAAASTSAELLGTAEKDSTWAVTAANVAPGWHKIDFQGQEGYVSARYLRLTAKANATQLTSLTVTGGTLTPVFSPDEYGYVVRAESDTVQITAAANDGVHVSVNATGRDTDTVTMPESGSKTVRISVGGKIRYTVYIVRGALVVGSWNIKRGNGHLEEQGRLIEAQQPDVIALQEVYRKASASARVDNLASLRTKSMQYTSFAKSLMSGSGEYGIGFLSRFEMRNASVTKLDSGSYEQRVLQRVEVEVDGKRISLYNTHLSFNSASLRKKQFRQILEAMNADTNPYKILFGDFNAAASEFSQLRGYTVVNTGDTKFFDYSGKAIRKNEIDNIVVSDNIIVLNSRMINNEYSDHKPLIAYLMLG